MYCFLFYDLLNKVYEAYILEVEMFLEEILL